LFEKNEIAALHKAGLKTTDNSKGNGKPATNNIWCFKKFYTTWNCGKREEIGKEIFVDTAGHPRTYWGCKI
jgi:hypothetical protein